MAKILRIRTCGIKNIDKEVVISFSNKMTDDGVKKFTNVKGIFGYNGSGKTALITSLDIYKNIVINPRYLLQDTNTLKLNELINKKIKRFWIEVIVQYKDGEPIIKHYLSLAHDKKSLSYFIDKEIISICKGRTLDEDVEEMMRRENNTISTNKEYEKDIYNTIDYLQEKLTSSSSLVSAVIDNCISYLNSHEGEKIPLEKSSAIRLIDLYLCVFLTTIYISSSDTHDTYFAKTNYIIGTLNKYKSLTTDFCDSVFFGKSNVIKRKDLKKYEMKNHKLCKFIQLFKPELLDIKTETKEYGEEYNVRDIFVYEDYEIDLELESTGIKHLVEIFETLDACANGAIAFIDEMDANINSNYLCKLVEFFLNYGKGQLCFTSHDLLAMDVLKKQGRSIDVIGVDLVIETWASQGNASPRTKYQNGCFANSPMNVEDFDFVSIFLEEKGNKISANNFCSRS